MRVLTVVLSALSVGEALYLAPSGRATRSVLFASDATAVQEALLSRRTVHHFEERPVPDDVLRRGLECAIRAPNHKLTEPWRFRSLGECQRS